MKLFKDIKGITGIRESFKTRQVKYGGYAALMTLAVITGLFLVNLIAGRFSFQVDMTDTKIFSLSEQSVQVLETVNTPVRFYALWRPGETMPLPNGRDYMEDVMTVISLYTSRNSNITVEMVDPDRNAGFARRYDRDNKGIARGSLIVEGEGGFRVIAPTDMYDISQTQSGGVNITGVAVERRITSALLSAGTGLAPVVYEITGYDTIPLADVRMQDELTWENYTLKSVNLLLSAAPSDASALILHSPGRDLGEGEVQKLLDYLESGGRLLVMADYNIRELANLNVLLASYGLRFDFGIVHETDASAYIDIGNLRLKIPELSPHDINTPLLDNTKTPLLIPTAMPLSILETRRRTIEITPLMTSSPAAFLRTNLDLSSQAVTASDIPGPHILAAAVTDPSWVQGDEPQARLVVIGSAALLQLGVKFNQDFFLNSLAWLQDRPETISLRSKSLFLLPLRLNALQVVVFGGFFIFIIPLAFFVSGFVTWLKRRHL